MAVLLTVVKPETVLGIGLSTQAIQFRTEMSGKIGSRTKLYDPQRATN